MWLYINVHVICRCSQSSLLCLSTCMMEIYFNSWSYITTCLEKLYFEK